MNLDDLKIQLNRKLEENQSFEMAIDSINNFQNFKTTSIAQKIKNSLITEIVFSMLFMLVFIYIAIYTKYTSIKIYFGTFSFLIFSFSVLLVFLLKKTNNLTASSLPVIQNLKKLHSLLSEFVTRYFQFTMFLIPICLIFSAYLGYTDAQKNINSFVIMPSTIDTKNQLILITIFIILFIAGMYYFTKWYLKKLYGNHLKELEIMIEQLAS
jgi:hypothetical protein